MEIRVSRLARRSLSGVRELGRSGIDFLYPPVCVLCHTGLSESRSAGEPILLLCAACREALAPKIEHACSRCSAPVGPHIDTVNGCMHCRGRRFAFETVIRLGVYADLLRSACLQAKQPRGRPLAAALAELLWQQERECLEGAGIDVVVPVPQHWSRRIARAHYPAATLARVLSHRLKVDFCRHILSKVRKTPAQAGLSRQRRLANLRRAFQVPEASIFSGLTVLLVDDILTTGTTANEASRVLRAAGAEQVYVAVVARSLGQSS